MVHGPRGTLRKLSAGKIGERVGRVSNRYKVAKHFQLEIADGAFSFPAEPSRSTRRPRSSAST